MCIEMILVAPQLTGRLENQLQKAGGSQGRPGSEKHGLTHSPGLCRCRCCWPWVYAATVPELTSQPSLHLSAPGGARPPAGARDSGAHLIAPYPGSHRLEMGSLAPQLLQRVVGPCAVLPK